MTTPTLFLLFLQKADRQSLQKDQRYSGLRQKDSKGKQLNKLTVDVNHTVSMFTYCILVLKDIISFEVYNFS